MKSLKITTSEIARICNVSQGTVDRALNNRADIKAETKQKILEVARQYGYRQYISTTPEKLVGQIGVIVFDLNNEYFSELITEVEFALRERGLGATVMMSHYDSQYEIECIRNLYNMGAKGIIICSVNNGKEFANYLELFDMPIVAVGNRVESLPYVGTDDFCAMKELTLKVREKGYDNIVYFSPALNYQGAQAQRARYEGFLNAMGDSKFSVVTNIDNIKKSYDDRTVIMCSNDYYAMQVYFRVDNVKVCGFDNIKAIEKYGLNITSVGYSMAEIGRNAVDVIVENKKDDIIIGHYIKDR